MKIQNEQITSARKLIEEERKRLLETPNRPDFKRWLGDRKYPLKWMKEQFGETLIEKDGFTHPNGQRFSDADCNVCGKQVNPDENIIIFSFSFCDEYDCGMNICHDCLKRLENKLRKENEINNK